MIWRPTSQVKLPPQYPNNEPHPVKRTEKKYKDFSQYDRYTVLWQPEIRVVCWRRQPEFPVFVRRRGKARVSPWGQDAEVSLNPAGIVVMDIAINKVGVVQFHRQFKTNKIQRTPDKPTMALPGASIFKLCCS